MFAAPPVVETRIFASLPEALRIRARSTHMSKFVARPLDSFLEGPSFDTAGNLYCVDVAFGRIFRIDPHGVFHVVVEYEGEPNGLKIHCDGRIFVADRRRGIVLIHPTEGRVETLVRGLDLEPFRGPNDLVFSADGDLYFTDQGMSDLAHPTGRIFRLRANGRLEVLLEGLPAPNGIAFDPSGSVLYVALTRANCVIRASVLADGRLTRVQNFIQLSGGGGPDGIAVDQDGGLAVAHPLMGAVWLFDSKGQPALRVNLCQGMLGTNLAYGGPDGRRLYITESETGTIQIADLEAPGLTLFSHCKANP